MLSACSWCSTDVAAVQGEVFDSFDVLASKDQLVDIEHPGPLLVQLQKPKVSAGLGLQLDLTAEAVPLIVDVVPGGPVDRYNAAALPAKQIRQGDYLIGVNGVRGDSKKMVAEIQSSARVQLEVWRPHVLSVTIQRRSGHEVLGLELDYVATGNSLVITGISNGAVLRWNRGCPDLALRIGDRILSVSGASDDPALLMCLLKANNPATMVLSRPSCPELPEL